MTTYPPMTSHLIDNRPEDLALVFHNMIRRAANPGTVTLHKVTESDTPILKVTRICDQWHGKPAGCGDWYALPLTESATLADVTAFYQARGLRALYV